MTVKLRFVSAVIMTIAGSQIAGSRVVAAEEVGEGKLQAAAYDIIIVPRDGRQSRSRIWTERGWSALPAQRAALPYATRSRASGTGQYPQARERSRSWAYGPQPDPSARYDRYDRTRDDKWRNGAPSQSGVPRSTWRPRYAERTY